jgi:hypothetical protein
VTAPKEPPLCAHCALPVVGDRGRASVRRDPRPLCGTGPLVPPGRVDCAGLVVDWGHPTPCMDCEGYAGPELDVPGLTWLAALDGLAWDAPEMTEAVTW